MICWSIVGLLVGHQVAYALVYRDPHIIAHALADTGHSWIGLVPVVCCVAFGISIVHSVRRSERNVSPRLHALILVSIQVIAFVAIEVVERIAHGARTEDLLAELGTANGALLFTVGLLLQLITAIGSVVLSRGIAAVVSYLLRARPARRSASSQGFSLPCATPYYGTTLTLQPVRGPPLLA